MTAHAPFRGWRAILGADGVASLGPVGLPDRSRALAGVEARTAPALAARLHALCPMAHGVAMARAIEAAADAPASDEIESAREAALRLEAAGAAALRFGLAWPAAVGAAPLVADLRAARAAEAAGDGAALASALRRLAKQARAAVTAAAREASLVERFEALSNVDALAKATASIARPPRSSLEVAPRDGRGAGCVDVARGRLRVEVTIAADRVSAAAVSTPTDRAMAPDGPALQALRALPRSPRWTTQARLVLLAFDPCTAVDAVEEAAHA